MLVFNEFLMFGMLLLAPFLEHINTFQNLIFYQTIASIQPDAYENDFLSGI